MKYILIARGDTNDADYISQETQLTQKQLEDKLPLIKKVAAILKESTYGWNTSEYARKGESIEEQFIDTGLLTEEEIDAFSSFMPHGENGIHTLESLVLHEVVSTTVFDV